MEVHHYLRADIASDFIFNAHEKMQNGGGKSFINGNNKQMYDFYKNGKQLFIGDYKYACMNIRVEKKNSGNNVVWSCK